MKTTNLAILTLYLFLMSCSNKHDAFYTKVLSGFDKSCYYIALNIKSSAYNGRVVIKNTDLYNYFNKTKSWDSATYKSRLKKILIHTRPVDLHNEDPAKWHFMKVHYINSVILNANRGVNSFIANYFDGTVLRSEILEDEADAIINQLFFWHIPVKYDSVSGEALLDS